MIAIKLAGVARLSHSLSRAKEFDFIAELNRVAPAREKLRVTRARFAVDLNGFRLQQK